MYLYFDKLGKLKEIINDESLRQGSDNVNTIYCFFEGDRIVNSVDFSILRNGDSQATTFDQDTDSPVVKEIPYDENRSLYYFKYFTNYTFYKYTLTQTNLSVSGVIKITIRAYDNANKIFALGLYVGNVETSSLQITSTITNSEYEDLLKVLSTKTRWVDIEKYIGISRQELVDFNKTNVIDYLGSVIGSMTSLDLTNLIYTPCEGDSKTLNVSGTLNAEQLRILNNFIAYKNIKILQVQLPNNYFNVVSTITSTGQLIGYSVDSQSPNVAHYFYINIDLKTGEVSRTSFVYSIATSQDIKIVEDKIKTINTSITDLTARVSANESLINTINTTLGETVTKLNAVDHTASTALLIAQNRTETITYNDNASLNSALPTLEKNTLKVGDNVFIIQTDVPDWWVSAINETIGTETLPTIVGGVFNKSYHIGYFTISQLETQKVDLTNYQTKEDASLTTTNKTIVGAINEVKAGGTIVVANNGQATTSDLKTITIDGVNYGVDEVADNTANPIDLGDVYQKLQTYSYSFEITEYYYPYISPYKYKIIKQRFKITLGTNTAMFDVYMKKASSLEVYCTYFGTLTYDYHMPIKVDLSCFYNTDIMNEQGTMVGGLRFSVFLDSPLNKISSDYDNDGISGGVLEALTFTDCANQRKSYYIPFVNQTAIPTQDLKAIQVGDNVYGIPTTNITASASISNTTGTPSVTVTTSGTSNAKDFKFAFSNLKGDTGPKGDSGTIVVANNGQATTQELTTLFVDSVNYSLPQGGGGGGVVTKIDYLPDNAPLQGIAIDGVNYRLVQQGGILNENCLAFGYNSSATSYNTSAFGSNSSATRYYSSAFGSNSSATSDNSSAFGSNSSATNYNTSAFGYNSSATGNYSSAFGSYSSVYVPSWVSIDGVNDSEQRTFTLKDTDHLFFRNENVNSTKSTQLSYKNGKTLTQVLNPLGVGIKNILSIILNKDESYEIPSTIGKHHLIVIGTKTSHSEGDTDKIGLVGVTNGAIFNEDISGNKAIEIDILRTPSGYYYKVTSVGSNGVYKILSGTDTFRLVYTVTTTMTTCSINIIDEFSQGETL